MRKKEKIGIVIPAANESATITKFCHELFQQVKTLKINALTFFVVDKASKDNTRELLQNLTKQYPNLKLIYAPENRHVADARVRGFNEALKNNCDFIIEMDCGFSHLPKELNKFILGYREGFDCVFGIRPLLSSKYRVPMHRRFLSLGGTFLANFLLGTHFTDMTSGYEGFTNKVLREILKHPVLSVDYFFQTEMRFRSSRFKYLEVPITYKFPTPRIRFKSLLNSFSALMILTKENWSRR
jgi:dolichol-phosphate mannosyltransferase